MWHKEIKHFSWSIMENKLESIMETKPLLPNEQDQHREPDINLKSLCRGALLFVILLSETVVQLTEKDSPVSKLQEDAVF